jgi:hypothetical protein
MDAVYPLISTTDAAERSGESFHMQYICLSVEPATTGDQERTGDPN